MVHVNLSAETKAAKTYLFDLFVEPSFY